MCVQNEPANIRFVEDCFQARRVRTFWQPKTGRRGTEEIDIHIAADQNLCTRRLRCLLLKNGEHAVRGGAGDDFKRARFA